MSIGTKLCLLTLLVAQLSSAEAALLGRVNGQAYYDTVLDMTWMADAHLAASNDFGVSGIESGGLMDWYEATNWIHAMNEVSYLGMSAWRLPVAVPLNGGENFVQDFTRDGSTDIATNISAQGTLYAGATASELAYMFYNTLGHTHGSYYIDGTDHPCAPSGQIVSKNSCLENSGPFSSYKLMSISQFWTGTDIDPPFDTDPYALSFSFYGGYQTQSWKSYPGFYAWAVTDGDPFLVPLPASVWLMFSGVGFLGAMTRRCLFVGCGTRAGCYSEGIHLTPPPDRRSV